MLDPVHHLYPILFIVYGFTPFIPHGEHFGHKLEGRKVAPIHPDHSSGPGVLPLIDPFQGPPATSTLTTIEFQQREQQLCQMIGWEAKRDQNTAAILVGETPYIITHNEF